MKINNDYIRELIRECMGDMNMGAPYPASTPPIVSSATVPPAGPHGSMTKIDPDGYEGKMAKQNLYKLAEHATMLQAIIQDNENLEPWVEEKIAVAASMMESVGNYLQYEKMRGISQGE